MDDDVRRLIDELQQRSVNWARVKDASDRKMRRMLASTPNLMSVSQLRLSLSGFPERAAEAPSGALVEKRSGRREIPRRSPLSGCTSSSWGGYGSIFAKLPVLLPDFHRQAASGASFAAPVATPDGPTNDGEDILTSCSSAPVRWLTRTLLAASTTPERAAVDLEACAGGACACGKPEFAPENLRFRRRLVAEIANRRPCRRRRRAGRRGTSSCSRRSETSPRCA